ncbi:two-component system sensor histidine kinase NtrB [Halalkalibacter urbisdiaboli]|uniref:two-component system sensor histidine kinase NtrB n=1 Tax=Halalkalibacter urbisdiaboli TaxID=1960589 RepID=UPI0010555538|nr:ATP-binding protein [Halalkalibacter urbisdiaboli]
MIKILWISYGFAILTNLLFDPNVLWPPFGLAICLGATLLLYFVKHEYLMMYIMICSIFMYFYVLNVMHAELINYLFIFLGIILSSLYQRYEAVLFSGLLASLLLFYFFQRQFDLMIGNIVRYDYTYFLLFCLLIVVFFLYHVNMTKMLWKRAQQSELLAKQRLKSTELRLDSFINRTYEAVMILNQDGVILQVNPAFTALFGWEPEEIVSKHAADFDFHFQIQSTEMNRLDVTMRNKCGQQIHVNLSLTTINTGHEHESITLVLIQDLTEKMKTEDFLRRNEKLATAGKLAASIAHELRNPLTVVMGLIKITDEKTENFSKHKQLILTELDRMKMITSELLLIAKPKDIQMKAVQLFDVFHDVFQLYVHPLKEQGIVLTYEGPQEVPKVLGDEIQLKQLFMNIIRNSAEAMKNNKGVIHVQIDCDEEHVYMLIQDEGSGIPSSVFAKIGEPFVTTKENGTGLGLMIMFNIMKAHHGTIDIRNREPQGAEVQLTFPRSQKKNKQ